MGSLRRRVPPPQRCCWLLPALVLLQLLGPQPVRPLPFPAPPTATAAEAHESDSDATQRVLGSSVVTSVSVIMDLGNGTQVVSPSEGVDAAVDDAPALQTPQVAGPPHAPPPVPPHLPAPRPGERIPAVASPAALLHPDRYEFYTFDEAGDLVKRFMTLPQIQSMIAGGDGSPLAMNSLGGLPVGEGRVPLGENPGADDATSPPPAPQGIIPIIVDQQGAPTIAGVREVVDRVQNVLRSELEASKRRPGLPPPSQPTAPLAADAGNPQGAWSVLLPAMLGAAADDSATSTTTSATSNSTPTSTTTTSPSELTSEQSQTTISSPKETTSQENSQKTTDTTQEEETPAIKENPAITSLADTTTAKYSSTATTAKPSPEFVPEIITETSISASFSSGSQPSNNCGGSDESVDASGCSSSSQSVESDETQEYSSESQHSPEIHAPALTQPHRPISLPTTTAIPSSTTSEPASQTPVLLTVMEPSSETPMLIPVIEPSSPSPNNEKDPGLTTLKPDIVEVSSTTEAQSTVSETKKETQRPLQRPVVNIDVEPLSAAATAVPTVSVPLSSTEKYKTTTDELETLAPSAPTLFLGLLPPFPDPLDESPSMPDEISLLLDPSVPSGLESTTSEPPITTYRPPYTTVSKKTSNTPATDVQSTEEVPTTQKNTDESIGNEVKEEEKPTEATKEEPTTLPDAAEEQSTTENKDTEQEEVADESQLKNVHSEVQITTQPSVIELTTIPPAKETSLPTESDSPDELDISEELADSLSSVLSQVADQATTIVDTLTSGTTPKDELEKTNEDGPKNKDNSPKDENKNEINYPQEPSTGPPSENANVDLVPNSVRLPEKSTEIPEKADKTTTASVDTTIMNDAPITSSEKIASTTTDFEKKTTVPESTTSETKPSPSVNENRINQRPVTVALVELSPVYKASTTKQPTTTEATTNIPDKTVHLVGSVEEDSKADEIEKDIEKEAEDDKDNDALVKRQEEADAKLGEPATTEEDEKNAVTTSSPVATTTPTTTTSKTKIPDSPVVYEDEETFNAYTASQTTQTSSPTPFTSSKPTTSSKTTTPVSTTTSPTEKTITTTLKPEKTDSKPTPSATTPPAVNLLPPENLNMGSDKEGTDMVNNSQEDEDNLNQPEMKISPEEMTEQAATSPTTTKPPTKPSSTTSPTTPNNPTNIAPEARDEPTTPVTTKEEPSSTTPTTKSVPTTTSSKTTQTSTPTTKSPDTEKTEPQNNEEEPATDAYNTRYEETALSDDDSPTENPLVPAASTIEEEGATEELVSSAGTENPTTVIPKKATTTSSPPSVTTTTPPDDEISADESQTEETVTPKEEENTEAPEGTDVPETTSKDSVLRQTTPQSEEPDTASEETTEVPQVTTVDAGDLPESTTILPENDEPASTNDDPAQTEPPSSLLTQTADTTVPSITTEKHPETLFPVFRPQTTTPTPTEVPVTETVFPVFKGHSTTPVTSETSVKDTEKTTEATSPQTEKPTSTSAPESTDIPTTEAESLTEKAEEDDSEVMEPAVGPVTTQGPLRVSLKPNIPDILETSSSSPVLTKIGQGLKPDTAEPAPEDPVVVLITRPPTSNVGVKDSIHSASPSQRPNPAAQFQPNASPDQPQRPQFPNVQVQPGESPSDSPLEPVSLPPAPAENLGLEASTTKLGGDVRRFASLCNELAFRLWGAVTVRGLHSGRSVVMSPLGVTSTLAMVFLGARGPTSGQMNDVLRLDDMVTFNPHQVFRNVTESVVIGRHPGIATAAFVRQLYSDRNKGRLLDFYKERANQFYDAHVEEVDFGVISDVVRRRTNLLVKRQTRGRVPEYLRGAHIQLHPPLAAFGANIFQTECSSASLEGRDGEMYFTVLPGSRQRRLVLVPAAVWRGGFMAGYDPLLDCTAAAIGGAKSLVSVIYLLPGQQGALAPGDGVAALERRLTEPSFRRGSWGRVLRSLAPRPGLELQIPRFSHRSLLNVTAALQRMGLKDLFNAERADLRGLNGVANDLHLSDIVQVNTFSTCAEDGAGGVRQHAEVYPAGRAGRGDLSGVPLALRPRQGRDPLAPPVPPAPRLRFDRPFLYAVRHNPTGFLLHMGRFNPHLLH